jgi:hypothetical protein
MEQSPLLLMAFLGLLYPPWMTDSDDCGTTCGMSGSETEVLGENLPSAALTTTDPTHALLRSRTRATVQAIT